MPSKEQTTRRLLLTDAGPLVALVLRDDAGHRRCRALLSEMKPAMVTTWPAFAESLFLAGRGGGWRAQDRLWRLVIEEDLVLADIERPLRLADLMAKYRDVPMDLADASLVALAEQQGHRRVFTLDSDFYVYRLGDGRLLEVLP